MSNLVLYGTDFSGPVRACLLTLHALELPFEYKVVNLMAGEHMTPEYLKRNPQHTVPVLDDDGTWLWDSHAICAYLVGKYGKSDELYPKDLAQRAVVDQRLHFDSSILFPSIRAVSAPLIRQNVTVVPKEKTANILEGYDLMETFLADRPYLAGEHLTIGDFACVASVTSMTGVVPLDTKKYPKLLGWLDRLAALPYYEKANGKGVQMYISFVRSKLTQIEM